MGRCRCNIWFPEEFRCFSRVEIVCKASAFASRSRLRHIIAEVSNDFNGWPEFGVLRLLIAVANLYLWFVIKRMMPSWTIGDRSLLVFGFFILSGHYLWCDSFLVARGGLQVAKCAPSRCSSRLVFIVIISVANLVARVNRPGTHLVFKESTNRITTWRASDHSAKASLGWASGAHWSSITVICLVELIINGLKGVYHFRLSSSSFFMVSHLSPFGSRWSLLANDLRSMVIYSKWSHLLRRLSASLHILLLLAAPLASHSCCCKSILSTCHCILSTNYLLHVYVSLIGEWFLLSEIKYASEVLLSGHHLLGGERAFLFVAFRRSTNWSNTRLVCVSLGWIDHHGCWFY